MEIKRNISYFLLLMLLDVVVHKNESHLRTPRREEDMNEIYCHKNIINDLVWSEQNMLILVLRGYKKISSG